jgi:hypothetical protein
VDVSSNTNNIFQNRTLFILPTFFPDLRYVTAHAELKSAVNIDNNVPGYAPGYGRVFDLQRSNNMIQNEYWGKEESDYLMYSQFIDLFSQKHFDRIQTVIEQINFEQHTVFGLHVRAGNGETGQFMINNRGIRDLNSWLINIMDVLCDYRSRHSQYFHEYPLMIYVATDTAQSFQSCNLQQMKDAKSPLYLQSKYIRKWVKDTQLLHTLEGERIKKNAFMVGVIWHWICT